MTDQQAFRFGFLGRCVERGLNLEQIKQAATKAAVVSSLLGKAYDTTMNLGSKALWLGAAAPLALGAAGGYGLARLQDIDETDVKDVQHQELLDTLKTETQRLRHAQALRTLQPPRGRSLA